MMPIRLGKNVKLWECSCGWVGVPGLPFVCFGEKAKRCPKCSRKAIRVKSGKPNKYRNKPTVCDGIRFDSAKEARRYGELKLLEKAGKISGLQLQPEFRLSSCGEYIGSYVGDFRYVRTADGHFVVEDVKSPATKTALYRWKKKHLKAQTGIEITEV